MILNKSKWEDLDEELANNKENNLNDKYNFINIVLYQGTNKRGNMFSRELLENNEQRFFNLLPFEYDDFTVSVNTKNNYLVLQSYYGLTAITHLKVEGIK